MGASLFQRKTLNIFSDGTWSFSDLLKYALFIAV